MEITEVKVRTLKKNKNSSLLAFATVTLDDELVLTGIKIIDGEKGKFVAMPSQYSEKEDDYFQVFFPITAEFREELDDAVMSAFKKASKKKKNDDDEEEEKKSSNSSLNSAVIGKNT